MKPSHHGSLGAKDNELNKECEDTTTELEDSWGFLQDELEDFEKALQSFAIPHKSFKVPKEEPIPKKKPPLMPKPRLSKNGHHQVSHSNSSSSRDKTCQSRKIVPSSKPYMETDI